MDFSGLFLSYKSIFAERIRTDGFKPANAKI
jgi:hypothetical protein